MVEFIGFLLLIRAEGPNRAYKLNRHKDGQRKCVSFGHACR